MPALYEWIGRSVWWRSQWQESEHIHAGKVVSVSKPTEDARRMYAFVLQVGWDKPRPVQIGRLNRGRRPYTGTLATGSGGRSA